MDDQPRQSLDEILDELGAGELEIVSGPWLSFATLHGNRGVGAVGIAATLKGRDLDDIEAILARLETLGLLQRRPAAHEGYPIYSVCQSAVELRERAFRQLGMRSAFVTHSSDFALDDVVLALAAGKAAAVRQIPHGFWGGSGDLLLAELRIILFDRTEEELSEAIDSLALAYLLERSGKRPTRGANDDAIRITTRGQISYETTVSSRLGVSATTNIYQTIVPRDFTIFFIWQSDDKRSRNHLNDALKRVIATANKDWDPPRILSIETGSMIGDGAIPLDTKIFERIRSADLVVADFTPIAEFCDSRCPNPNVLVEVGYALGCQTPENLLIVEWTGDERGIPADGCDRPFPFDIDKIRRLTYSKPAELRSKLKAELCARLRRDGWHPADEET